MKYYNFWFGGTGKFKLESEKCKTQFHEKYQFQIQSAPHVQFFLKRIKNQGYADLTFEQS